MVNEVAGEQWLDADAVPLRRLQPAQRSAAAAAQAGDRRLRRPRLRDGGLTWSRRRLRVRPGAGVARHRAAAAVLRDLRRRRVPRRRAARRSRRSTPPTRRRSPRSPRPARPTSTTRSRAARRAYDGVWGRMPGRERAKYLFRIARAIQERARELAVLESLDNGKPIRESRDVDIPLAAAHFFYYAGWADKLRARRLRPDAAADRRRRADHPVELPAADGRVEDRARARRRQHGRAQAGRDDAADGADARRDHRRGRPAAGRRQHPRRRPGDRAGDRRARRHRQDRVHRLDRGRQGSSSAAIAGTGQAAARSSSAARPPTSCSTTPRSTRPSRASSTGSSSTRATSAAPARACSSRSRSPTR